MSLIEFPFWPPGHQRLYILQFGDRLRNLETGTPPNLATDTSLAREPELLALDIVARQGAQVPGGVFHGHGWRRRKLGHGSFRATGCPPGCSKSFISVYFCLKLLHNRSQVYGSWRPFEGPL